jgi:hypothetical protein
MNVSQTVRLARRWEIPIVRTFFVGVMTLLGLIGTGGRALWATSLAPGQPPLPIWANMLLYALGLLFIGLWIRSALVAFRDVRTRFTPEHIVRPMWLRKELIMWYEITHVTITPASVALTTPSITFGIAFEAFRKPEQLLTIIREHVPATTPIDDIYAP